MNCDPIGIGDGVNVYAYCRNQPMGNTDARLYDAADPSSPGGSKYFDGYIAAYETRKIMENPDLKWYRQSPTDDKRLIINRIHPLI